MEPSHAGTLWIEAGAMSGGSRNQIEFDEALVAFFTDDPPRLNATIELALGANTRWLDCVLAHKQTTFGVDIYRLSMPTLARGGFDYAGKVVSFERNGPYASRYFQISVTEVDGDLHNDWRSRSASVDRTAGGREYGLIP